MIMKKVHVEPHQQKLPLTVENKIGNNEEANGKGTAPIENDRFSVSPTMQRRAASRFVTARNADRHLTETGLAIRYEEHGVYAELEMRDKNTKVLTQDAATNLRDIAKRLGGVDEDVLDLLLANAIRNAPEPNGWHWIDVDEIIRARGRGLRKRNDGSGYKSGIDYSAREDVVKAVKLFSSVFVSVGKSTNKNESSKKNLTNYDPLLIIERIVVDDNKTRQEPVRFAYRFGSGLADVRMQSQSLLAPRSLLQLNGKTEKTAKDLGRQFVLHANTQGIVKRVVSAALQGSGIELEENETNRGRIRHRIEKALHALVERGVLRSWNYEENTTEMPPAQWADQRLPNRSWIETWLTYTIKAQVDVRVGKLVGEPTKIKS